MTKIHPSGHTAYKCEKLSIYNQCRDPNSLPWEVWPDLAKFRFLGKIIKLYLVFANFLWFWAKFHRCKWPNKWPKSICVTLNHESPPLLHMGEVSLYSWPPVWTGFEFNQTSKYVDNSTNAKQLNPKKKNMRSAVQWYFP